MIELTTARLRLREMNDADAAFLLEVLNEPAFLRYIGDRRVRTVEAATGYLRERITSSYRESGFGMWLVESVEGGELIGICGLIKRESLDDVDLGFSFLARFWSRGYAREAAMAVIAYAWNVVELSRLVAITSPENAASMRLLAKLGFTLEKRICLEPGAPESMLFALAWPVEAPEPAV